MKRIPDRRSIDDFEESLPSSPVESSDISQANVVLPEAFWLPEELEKVDIAIITIREDEFEAVLQRFNLVPYHKPGSRTYGICRFKTKRGGSYTIVVTRCSEQGNDTSQRLTHDIIHDLDPQLILVVGIAGGVPHDEFTLGDIIVSSRIYNLDAGAQQEDGGSTFDIRGGIHPRISDITGSLLLYQDQLAGWNDPASLGKRPDVNLQRAKIHGSDTWRKRVRASLDLHFGAEPNRTRPPKFKTGAIASSNNLIRNPFILQQWRNIARSILAVEMESAGVYEAAQGIQYQYPVMAIRGISDIIGLERDGGWTAYACQAAAAFTYAFIMTNPIDPQRVQIGLPAHTDVSKLSLESLQRPGLPNEQRSTTVSQLFERRVKTYIRFPEAFPSIWNVPYRHNPFFTAREHILEQLHQGFQTSRPGISAPILAITGLGGVGKTLIATEYAFRFRNDYRQAVLWVRADSEEALISDFITLACPDMLNVPEQGIAYQSRIIHSVKRWLREHTDWLLIFDNADDLALVNQFLPVAARGHILLTTRALATGDLAQEIKIEPLNLEEGASFLLARAKMVGLGTQIGRIPEGRLERANAISRCMDGLPLAIDQAGAYIEETKCGLEGYLNLYTTHRSQLMKERGGPAPEYIKPVAAAWTVSKEYIQKTNPAATELLYLCAFLYPDAIPEEIIAKGAPDLGPVLQSVAADPFKLNAVLKDLRSLSLLDRDPEAQTLTIHRLVQTVLVDGMDQQTQHMWSERAVRAVNRVFPQGTFTNWQMCQRYLPQVQVCKVLIEQEGLIFKEAAQLFQRVGLYLYEKEQYNQAQSFYQLALLIYRQTVEPNDPEILIMQKYSDDLREK